MKVSKIGGAGVLVLALILAVVPLNSKDYKGECGSALAPAKVKGWKVSDSIGVMPIPQPPTFPVPTTSVVPTTTTSVGIKLQVPEVPGEIFCDEAVKNRRILSGVIAGLGILILGGTLLKSESSSSSRPVSPPLKPEPKVEEPKEPESQPTDTKSFCSQCGEKLTEGAKFCSECGAVV